MRGFFGTVLLAGIAASLSLPQIAHAQFGGLFNDVSRGATANDADSRCRGGRRSRGGMILGNVLGGAASRTAGRAGVPSFVPLPEFRDTLTDAIACKLDDKEQAQAANATNQAVAQAERSAGGSAGASGGEPQTVSWQSDTRQNVSGTSTVDSQNRTADGTSCMNVTDVVIVEGEETRVQKKMCKAPGQSRYVLAA